MKIENTHVYGFVMSIEGMRNPRESHHHCDSIFYGRDKYIFKNGFKIYSPETPDLGSDDVNVMKRLIMNGEPHCKFMRQIIIWARMTLPRFIWVDMDTYKVATVRNSSSTRYATKLKEFSPEDFECSEDLHPDCISYLNKLRNEWVEGSSEDLIKMKRNLPEDYLQKANYMMSYSTAISLLHQRWNHPLPEFNIEKEGSICQWIMSLPYMEEFYEAYVTGIINRAENAKIRLEKFKVLRDSKVF